MAQDAVGNTLKGEQGIGDQRKAISDGEQKPLSDVHHFAALRKNFEMTCCAESTPVNRQLLMNSILCPNL
jgi:hypothetical protein